MYLPSPVCPYLGFKIDPQVKSTTPNAQNVCNHSRPVSTPSMGYQRTFCLKEFHSTCQVYNSKQPVPMPLGFSGNVVKTAAPSLNPTAVLWLIIPLIFLAIFGTWGVRIISSVHPASALIPSAPVSGGASATPTPVYISQGITPTETIAPTFVYSRTPTGTPPTTPTVTRTSTISQTPIPYTSPTITPTNNPAFNNQTITFNTLSDRPYGPDFIVSAVASSGLPVSFGTLGSCSNHGATITMDNAGSCTVIAFQGGDASQHINPAPQVARVFAISKAYAVCTMNGYNWVYDGGPYSASPGTCIGTKGEFVVGNWDVSHTTHTNAGSYYNEAWTFTDTSGNYRNASGTVNDVITKRDPDCTSITRYSVVYSGLAHTASGSCLGAHGEILLGLSLSGTSHTNAGTYSADGWTFIDVTGNYNNKTGTLSDSIAKANPTCNISPYSVTYDTNPHLASGTCHGVGGPGDILFGLTLPSAHTNAGTYSSDQWTFTDTTTYNYNNASGAITDSIAKYNTNCSILGYSFNYDANAHTATGTCTGVGGVTLTPGLDLSGTTHTNAGNHPADNWTFIDTSGNYQNKSGSVADNIARIDPTCSAAAYNLPYDENSHTATGSCTGVGGVTLTGLDLSGTTHTNAGSYPTDGWTFTDSNGNYNTKSGSVSDTITSVDASCSVSGYSLTYDGSAHTASGSCLGVKSDVLSGLDVTHTSHTNAGSYLSDYWNFTDPQNNYNPVSNTTVSDTIAQASATCSSIAGYTVTYDGNSHTASGSCTGIGLNPGDTDKSSTQHTNANIYSGDAWSFSDPANNYTSTGGTVNDTINKADASCTVLVDSTTYDGNSHGALSGSACTGLGGTVNLTSGLSVDSTTYTEVPGGSIGWTFSGGTNFNDITSSTYLTISKADQSISFGSISDQYLINGSITVSASASSSLSVTFNAGPSGVCTASGNTITFAGTGVCTVTASQSGNNDYNAAPNVPQSFSIN